MAGKQYPKHIYPYDTSTNPPGYDPRKKYVWTDGLVIAKEGEGEPFWTPEEIARIARELAAEYDKPDDADDLHKRTLREARRVAEEERRPIDPKDVKP